MEGKVQEDMRMLCVIEVRACIIYDQVITVLFGTEMDVSNESVTLYVATAQGDVLFETIFLTALRFVSRASLPFANAQPQMQNLFKSKYVSLKLIFSLLGSKSQSQLA